MTQTMTTTLKFWTNDTHRASKEGQAQHAGDNAAELFAIVSRVVHARLALKTQLSLDGGANWLSSTMGTDDGDAHGRSLSWKQHSVGGTKEAPKWVLLRIEWSL